MTNLGNKRCIMLRNHGPVVMGETLGEMYLYYWLLQRACEVQLATLSMGPAIDLPSDVIAIHQRDMAQGRPPGGTGAPDLAAWTRRIDKIDPSWRD
jgi:ribulose-5-phosphate 4-epimerase/fuculose-1-phosphate aldolase